MEKMTFFTFATGIERGFPQYIASCIRNGIEPQVLGMGERWDGRWSRKIQLVRARLDHLDDAELVVVTDSYDLVFQKGPVAILHEFKSYNKPLVISSEQGPGYPHDKMRLPETPNPLYRTLCAGFWMGYVNAAREMIDQAWNWQAFDVKSYDQGVIDSWFARNPDKMVVDYKNIIVTSAARKFFLTDFACRDGVVYNPITDTVPCAIHGNGNSDMTRIFQTLGLLNVKVINDGVRWMLKR